MYVPIQINGHQLQPGDIVKHKMSHDTFVVTANYGNYAIAVKSVDISNPREWDLIDPVSWRVVEKFPLESKDSDSGKHCHADSDGDCEWANCPQLRDGEPRATGRHCPLDRWSVEDER